MKDLKKLEPRIVVELATAISLWEISDGKESRRIIIYVLTAQLKASLLQRVETFMYQTLDWIRVDSFNDDLCKVLRSRAAGTSQGWCCMIYSAPSSRKGHQRDYVGLYSLLEKEACAQLPPLQSVESQSYVGRTGAAASSFAQNLKRTRKLVRHNKYFLVACSCYGC